jgi:hypothetical protein
MDKPVKNFLITYVSAVLSMAIIYLIAMYVHMRHLDFGLLRFALARIVGVAVIIGGIGMLIPSRYIKLKIVAGIILGPVAGAIFIRLFYY